MSKGARSGHPERWSPRAIVKTESKKARRVADRRVVKEA